MFRKITLPMIPPVIFYNVVLTVIGLMQYFVVPYVLSNQTRSNRSTNFINLHLYRTAFTFQDMGYASALAWLPVPHRPGHDPHFVCHLPPLGVLRWRRLKHGDYMTGGEHIAPHFSRQLRHFYGVCDGDTLRAIHGSFVYLLPFGNMLSVSLRSIDHSFRRRRFFGIADELRRFLSMSGVDYPIYKVPLPSGKLKEMGLAPEEPTRVKSLCS